MDAATLEFGGPATGSAGSEPANDKAAIGRASREYFRKYVDRSYAQTMVKAEPLATTLRLEPR